MDGAEEQQIFENDIEMYLEMFREEQGIDDLRTIPQSVWNAALMYIRRHVFADSNILKLTGKLPGYNNNDYEDQHNNINKSNCNAYDISKVNAVCDYYIYLCMLYAKEVSIIGFSNLTGIYTQTIHQWGNDERKLSKSGLDLYKKLTEFNEESLSNILISSTRSPVGPIAALNRRHGWASPYTSDSNKQKQALTGDDVRRLLSDNSSQKLLPEG